MNEPTLKLQRNADELLREFPGNEPDFEAQARAIEARLKGSPGGVVFDDLLRVPELPPEPGEGAAPSSVRAASAPKSNFAEMARKSVQKQDDATELAKELLAATAHSRRPNAEMVERVRAAGRAAATATPLPTTETTADEARPSGVVTRAVAPAAAPAAPTNDNGNRIGIIFGVVGSLVAIAACVALFLKSGQDDGRSSAAALAAAQKANDAPATAAATPAAATPAAKSNEGVVSPEALKEASPAAAHEVAAVGAAPKTGGAPAPAAAPGAKAAPSASPSAVAQQPVVLEEDPEPAQSAPAEPKATPAPAAEPPLKPAEGNTGSVPLQPSAGAISTALSSVRASAQACLAGQTDPVSATVTFASDGHVLRVSAGGPAGACIQAALSKAHIAPFAKESFSAPTTIRPP
ncbi:MAG TPA: hypothetical protein VHP33_40020 [Polyangiaceae bacterium]|nr:hypothetical protein [Polyangiaceae bacterium]